MVVVFAVLLWREFFAGKVNNAKDAAYATHLPVIGTIPDMRSVSGTKNYFHDGNQGGKAQKAYSEAYRSLRTNFLYRAKKNAWKSFLITSSVQKEDEYNVASNLGLALAEAGKKTIVVDCNMRRGELNNYLHFNHSVGLSQVLTGEAQWAEAISEVDDSDLKAICSGKSENPSELLSNSAMEQLLAELKNKYEYVLLVAPNAAGVTDASVLGAISDGVVLVTRIRFAKMDTIRMAMGNLKSVNSNIIGVVLTKMVVRKQYGNQAYAEVQKRSF
jgi:receptor protein-tyrosine kinase